MVKAGILVMPVFLFSADRSSVTVPWKALEDSLRRRDLNLPFSSKEIKSFHDYVASVAAAKRVQLLLEAYRVYRGDVENPRRGCDALIGDERRFEKTVASVLIGALLKSRIKPNQQETCEILRNAFHYCGHGSDVLAPVDFIEIAFQDKPFTPELFEAARTYRETLRELRGSQAVNASCRLHWVSWHDVSNPDAQCYTGAIQRAIAAMDAEEAFAWQWLLRKTVPGFRPGKTWPVEIGKRLDILGRDKFLKRLAGWIVAPRREALLTEGGANVLRLLVYHATLYPTKAVVPILERLIQIPWTDEMPAWRVYNALAVLLAQDPAEHLAEAIELCRRFAGPCYEVGQLEAAVNQASQSRGR